MQVYEKLAFDEKKKICRRVLESSRQQWDWQKRFSMRYLLEQVVMVWLYWRQYGKSSNLVYPILKLNIHWNWLWKRIWSVGSVEGYVQWVLFCLHCRKSQQYSGVIYFMRRILFLVNIIFRLINRVLWVFFADQISWSICKAWLWGGTGVLDWSMLILSYCIW